MTDPIRSARVLLLADGEEGRELGPSTVRRYRLARLRLDGRDSEPELRYEHLKRVYD